MTAARSRRAAASRPRGGRAARIAGEAAMFARYARGLRRYLRECPGLEAGERTVVEALAARERNLVRLLEEGVFGARESPYLALFRQAGIERADAVRLVSEQGVEGALARFHDAGVYVGLDEFKGRRPIVRGGLELPVRDEDFDNPRTAGVHHGSTGGSRGPARRTKVDFAHLTQSVVRFRLAAHALGVEARPHAFWRPVPPGHVGILGALAHSKLGRPLARWFTQYPLTARHPRELAFTLYTLLGSRLAGVPIPAPEHVPLDRAIVVARWLEEQRARGEPALLDAPGSSGVRVCRAARDAGLDISGTLFRFGGEPLTEGKARAVRDVGCDVRCHYAMAEIGRIGLSCVHRTELDDVHVLLDCLGVLQREREVGEGGARVGALLYTTLLPTAPKLMLNVESDDYGVLVERECGCPLGELGLTLHLHTIRSYEKLQSEGMNFVGVDLLQLVEDVLPARFGGGPSDYQLVEEEVAGLPQVSVVVSPRLGEVDAEEVVRAVLDTLGSGPAYKDMMASVWRSGETLQVVRREPYATSSAKIQPLHIVRQ